MWGLTLSHSKALLRYSEGTSDTFLPLQFLLPKSSSQSTRLRGLVESKSSSWSSERRSITFPSALRASPFSLRISNPSSSTAAVKSEPRSSSVRWACPCSWSMSLRNENCSSNIRFWSETMSPVYLNTSSNREPSVALRPNIPLTAASSSSKTDFLGTSLSIALRTIRNSSLENASEINSARLVNA